MKKIRFTKSKVSVDKVDIIVEGYKCALCSNKGIFYYIDTTKVGMYFNFYCDEHRVCGRFTGTELGLIEEAGRLKLYDTQSTRKTLGKTDIWAVS